MRPILSPKKEEEALLRRGNMEGGAECVVGIEEKGGAIGRDTALTRETLRQSEGEKQRKNRSSLKVGKFLLP